jgi:surface polysaccharide O-acyltransferase-like enzyme
MTAYLSYTKDIAEATPESRNRIIDFWRVVAILAVVFGHWMAASIWVKPDGEIALLNALQWIPYSAWITWIVQVMPIFFFVGGYANARALRKVETGEQRRREWITTRVRRLYTPVIPLLIVWTVLIVVMRTFVEPEVVRAASMSATVPLWFIAVYLGLVAVAPLTHRWWNQYGLASVAAVAGVAVGVDIARFVFEVPGIGWVNFLFVWAAIHQLGYWWASRDGTDNPITTGNGWTMAAGALAALIAVTWIGWYPVAMIGIPGAGLTNMTPPTSAMMLLGLMQAGVILGTQNRVAAWTQRPRTWHFVVAVSGVIMTIYLWHLTAMSIVAGVGLFTFDGAAFKVEPGTWAWFLTRPIWIAVLVAVTLGLVAIFARFEWRIGTGPMPEHRRWVTLGVLLTAGSAAAVSWYGLATEEGVINWIIPAAAIAGAVLMGAMPRLGKSKKKTEV